MRQAVIYNCAIVYQAGIANVFALAAQSGDPAERVTQLRLQQGSFESCEQYARGLAAAGVCVACYHCCKSGDVSALPWAEWSPQGLFANVQRPVRSHGSTMPVNMLTPATGAGVACG